MCGNVGKCGGIVVACALAAGGAPPFGRLSHDPPSAHQTPVSNYHANANEEQDDENNCEEQSLTAQSNY